MKKISTCLWFDGAAEKAVDFYTSTFKNTKIGKTAYYTESSSKASGQKQGSVMTITFELEGLEFMALNGGPHFKFTPAISFMVNCESEAELKELFKKLSDGGTVLMELGKYPFSEMYAWVNDKFGVSWQLNLNESTQKIVPFLMFVKEQYGRAEDAAQFYVLQFPNSNLKQVVRYGPDEGEREGEAKNASFSLNGQEFIAMDSGADHTFAFSLATSFMVYCDNQDEIDAFWDNLSAGGEPSQCGWLTDRFGIAWQIVPSALDEMILDENKEKSERVMAALMKMRKIEIGKLLEAQMQA